MSAAVEAGPWIDDVLDVDTHEMVPFHMWGEQFGEEVAEKLAPAEHSPRFRDNGANTIVLPGARDEQEITTHTVWNAKGVLAPGAIDMRRRPAVMDAMGVSRALLFPSFGLVGIRHPNVCDCFCFSTDYPHVEGGRDTRARQYELLECLGEGVLRRYFQANGELLLPDMSH